MLDEYKNEQTVAYRIFINAIKKNKLSHAYLIEANGYSKKNEFAYSFAKYILCKEHHTSLEEQEKCDFCKRSNENQTDIKVIKPDGLMIKKKQMEDLRFEFSKKSIDSEKKVYIIQDADKLNTSSANAILKFLEEPEEGIIAILIVDNMYQLLDTIISRCQVINLTNEEIRKYDTFEEKIQFLLGQNIDQEWIQSITDFSLYLEKNKISTVAHLQTLWNKKMNTKESSLIGMELLLWLYKDCLNKKINRDIEIFDSYEQKITEICKLNTEKSLCTKIGILLEIKENILYNANTSLSMDMLVKKFSEVTT